MLNLTIASIIHTISNPLLIAVILGFSPISEVRGAAVYAFSINQPWLIIPAALASMLASLVILAVWEVLNVPFWGAFILGKGLEKKLLEFGKSYNTYGFIALVIFMGVPLPLFGVYSGTLIAELFGIKRRHTILAAIIGVLISATVSFLILGGLSMILR